MTFFSSLGETAAPTGEGCGPCPDYPSYTLEFALQLRKITENISQGMRKPLGLSASTAILLVVLSFSSEGRERLACPCHPWLSRQTRGSTLSQRKYLPSCRTTVFPKTANFELKLGVTALMLSASSGTPR